MQFLELACIMLCQFARRSHLVITYKYTKSAQVDLLATLFVFKATWVVRLEVSLIDVTAH